MCSMASIIISLAPAAERVKFSKSISPMRKGFIYAQQTQKTPKTLYNLKEANNCFFRLKQDISLFHGVFLNSVKKVKSCPIIGGRFGAFHGLLPSIFAVGAAVRGFCLKALTP